eukprot:1195049-Prorocentrum_minimum.AAC.2
MDTFVTVVFTLNVIVSLTTAVVTSDGIVVTNLKEIRKHYMQNGGITEIIASPPLGLIYFEMYQPHPDPHYVNLLALNRMLMVVRQV